MGCGRKEERYTKGSRNKESGEREIGKELSAGLPLWGPCTQIFEGWGRVKSSIITTRVWQAYGTAAEKSSFLAPSIQWARFIKPIHSNSRHGSIVLHIYTR